MFLFHLTKLSLQSLVGKSLAAAGQLTTDLWGESHANPLPLKSAVLSQPFPIAGHLPITCKMGIHAHKILSTDSSFP